MHIFLNGLGASAGAGLTYLYNVVPELSAAEGIQTTVAVQPELRSQFADYRNVRVLQLAVPSDTARRFWFEQKQLPRLIKSSGAQVLISAGNFATRNSPVPQILLSGNSLYTSHDFSKDLLRRGEYRMLVDTWLRGIFAKKSVQWADCTIAPSRAFAADLQQWTGKQVQAVYHGFNPDLFFRDQSPLAKDVQNKLDAAHDCLRLLCVSHYNYYRNFETIFRAVAILRERLPERKIRLFLTCTLDDAKTPGIYRTAVAASLIQQLGIRREVIELGTIPYTLLHKVYRACDLYVTAAYAETFAHPLVEAMESGLPIVASDLPVHREVCGDAAIYFPRFSADDLASAVLAQARTNRVPGSAARERFSWRLHVEQILRYAAALSGHPRDAQALLVHSISA